MPHPSDRTSATLGDWTTGVLLSLNLVWTTLCLGGYLPGTMVWTWVLNVAALIVQIGTAAWSGRRYHPAGWMLVPFIVYAAANAIWVSPVPWLAWRDWLGWAHLCVTFWVAVNLLPLPGPRKLILGTVLGLGVVAVILASYQRFVAPDWLMLGRTQADQFIGRASGPFGIPNSLAAFLLLLIPPMLTLTWQSGASAIQRIVGGYLALVFLFGLGLTISRGAWLFLALALTMWPLFVRRHSWPVRLTLSVTAFTALLMIGFMVYQNVPRVRQRFDTMARQQGEVSRPILWNGAVRLFSTAPVVGTGAGSYNVLFEEHRPPGFKEEPEWAHNDYLNTLSDLGAAGFLLFFGAIGWIVRRAAKQPVRPLYEEPPWGWDASSVTSGLVVGLVAFGLALAIDFHLKIPALGMLAVVVGAEGLTRRWRWTAPEAAPGATGRTIALVLASLAVIFLLAGPFRTFRAEAARWEGRSAIDRLALGAGETPPVKQKIVFEAASRMFADALVLDSQNAQAWSDRAYVIALSTRLAPPPTVEAGKLAEEASRAALAVSTVVPEFWIRLGVALDLQGRHTEGGQAFVRALRLAPNTASVWYYYAYHQSLTPTGRPLAHAAIETCLHLDPSNRLALTLRENLSRTQ